MSAFRLIPCFVLALVMGLATTATAARLPEGVTAVPLATITNDRDATVSHLKLMVDDQHVRGIYLDNRASAHSGPSPERSQVYWLTGIEKGNGVVLGQGQGVKAIFLRGEIAAGSGEGTLVVRYLANGLFRNYDECRINLQRTGPQQWRLVNAYNGQPIQRIRVETWMLGISTLANVCPGTMA